ncbi:MAG TPA: MAPEG family protein [Stellaceae bacterium]|nr:MAPEG family protein [Stellaceae bacterium]
MHIPLIVTFYAGLNGLIALALAVLVVRLRVKTKTDLGSGGHPALEQAIRAHGNFIEYVPIILLLLLLLELCETRRIVLHGLGAALTIGRILHAWGLYTTPGESVGRLAGISLTWATLLIAAVLAIVHGAAAL